MGKVWSFFLDHFAYTIINPQFFLKSFEHEAINSAKKYATGTLVDIGCGRQTYKSELLPFVKKYIGVDHPEVSKKYKYGERPDILADATDIPLPDRHCNIALMISVLEHFPEPRRALDEAYRILKKNGVLVLITVQHYPLHDVPYDFFRYTPYGLKQLLTQSKFRIIKTKPLGNFSVLTGQYFNVFWLYKAKSLVFSKALSNKMAGFLLLLIVAPFLILSNIIVWAISPFFNAKTGTFAIYNLVIAKK